MAEQTQTAVTTATTEPVGEKATGTTAALFTQADVDRIVQERLSRAKSQPDDAELAEFRKWKSSQKSHAEKEAESAAALSAARAEIAQLKTQAKVSAAEVKPEFAEFVTAQILAMSGNDIDANIKAYKKDHPQYFGTTVVVKKSTSPGLSGAKGGDTTTNDIMNSLLRGTRGQA